MKKTIKKLALILLIATLMLTVTGCGANDYQAAATRPRPPRRSKRSVITRIVRRSPRRATTRSRRTPTLPKTTSRPARFSPRSATIKRALRSSPHATMRSRRTPMTPESTRTPRSSSLPSAIIKTAPLSPRRPATEHLPKSCSEAGYRAKWMYRRSSSTPYTMPLMTTNPPKRFWTAWSSALFP